MIHYFAAVHYAICFMEESKVGYGYGFGLLKCDQSLWLIPVSE